MTTLSDLPEDLVREMLSSIPLASVSAVRCTCKSWNALSKHQVFGKAQVEDTQQFLGFTVVDSKVCSLRLDLQGICNHGYDDFGDPSIVSLGKSGSNIKNKTFKKNNGSGRHQKISKSNFVKPIYPISIKQISEFNKVDVYDKVFHSGGLLLCVTNDLWSLMVWNPYLGQIRWIQLRRQYSWAYDNFTMGYDNNNRNHKIIMFCFRGGVEIYDFNSNSWRVVEFTPIRNLHRCAVSLKGNTYFFVFQDKIFAEEKYENYFLCFDFTAERFGPRLPLPFHSYGYKAGAVTLSSVRQEQLALLYYNCETVIKSLEIWVTNHVDPNAVSWSKFWKVDITGRTRIPKNILPGSFFIDQVKKVAVVSDLNEYNFRTKKTGRYQTVYIIGEDGYFKSFKLRCSASHPHDFLAYAPSLVHIQTNQPGKKKRRKRKNNRRKITN